MPEDEFFVPEACPDEAGQDDRDISGKLLSFSTSPTARGQ
jgi:hypothetical protein